MDYISIIKDKLKEEKREKPSNVIYVTDLVTCQALRQFYVETEDDSAQLHGKLIHNSVESIFSQGKCDTEVSVVYKLDNFDIVGRLDMLCNDEVVEIKTTKDLKLHHLYQLLIYMYILRKNNGVLLYINPSGFKQYNVVNNYDGLVRVEDNATHEVKVYIIKMDDDFLRSLISLYLKGELYAQFNQCFSCYFRPQCDYHK